MIQNIIGANINVRVSDGQCSEFFQLIVAVYTQEVVSTFRVLIGYSNS